MRVRFLPAGQLGILVAPELVVHYIRDHHYRPPDVFLDAVDRCPPMKSAEYFAALRGAGGDAWSRMAEES